MQRKSVSRILMATIPIMIVPFVLAGASAMAQSDTAHSGNRQCSNRTLFGDYGFAIEGVLLPAPGVTLPGRGLAMGGASTLIMYSGVCASLIRLRKLRPEAPALHIPLGAPLAVTAIGISLGLISALDSRQALLMGGTALIATANWWGASRQETGKAASTMECCFGAIALHTSTGFVVDVWQT
jgi:hypothetical protein